MFNDTVTYLLTKKGQFVSFNTVRDMKVRKGVDPIRKESEFVARIGVAYDNIKNVQEKREDGRLPEENQGLPWGTWAHFPYVIEHKSEYYVRCSVAKGTVGKAHFFQNGVEISREEAKAACLASEFKEKTGDEDIFNIKASSIISAK